MSRSSSRFAVFVFNFVIAVLSAAAILAYFAAPLWRVKAQYTLQPETLEKMLGEEAEKVNVREILDEDITVKLSLELKTTELFAAFTDNSERETIERTVENNLNKVVEQITPALKEIAKRIVRSTAQAEIDRTVREQVKNFLAADDPEVSDERVEEILDKAGFTDEYIARKTNEFIDAVYAEGATVNSVSETAVAAVEEVFGKLAESGEEAFENATLSETNKETVRENVAEALSMISDEDGNIDVDEMITGLLLDMLRSAKDNGSETTQTTAYRVLSASQETQPTEESTEEELKKEVKDYLMAYLSENVLSTATLSLKIAAAVVGFSMLTWAYLIVKMLLKLGAKNPAIKLKLPIWLGWLPFLILVALPTAAVALLKKAPSLLDKLNLGGASASIGNLLSSLSLSFTSSAWIAFAAAVALIVIWIPYSSLRRRLKRGSRYDRYEYRDEDEDDEDED